MVCKKSQKISTASDQYFLSYVKKTTGGGQIDPPPAGIGLIGALWRRAYHIINIELLSFKPGCQTVDPQYLYQIRPRSTPVCETDRKKAQSIPEVRYNCN